MNRVETITDAVGRIVKGMRGDLRLYGVCVCVCV